MPSPDMLELLLSWAVTTTLLFVLVILDERHLDEERLERAWPPSSRDAALVSFGVLALPIHFARTRGHFRSARGVLGVLLGLAMGAVAVVIVSLVSGLVVYAIGRLMGWPVEL
jgi:hypothetical protein